MDGAAAASAAPPPPGVPDSRRAAAAALLDPGVLLLLACATATVAAAATRALEHERDAPRGGLSREDEAAVTLTARHALLLPLASSAVLLALFYAFTLVQLAILVATAGAAGVGVAFTLAPLVDALAATPRHRWLARRVALCGLPPAPAGALLRAALAAALVARWAATGSLALNDLLGAALCVAFVAHVRLPDLRVATQLLCGLFFYDLFWVYASPRLAVFGGDNVMVKAATARASNPAWHLARLLRLPDALTPVASLELPVKLLFPSSGGGLMMLGLGDVALPALLAALLLAADAGAWAARGGGRLGAAFLRQSYFARCLGGFVVGLAAALGASTVFHAAQPALLFLVPATLGPALWRARRRGELAALWRGDDAGGGDAKSAV
jgi:hypothetical protein